MKVELIAVAQPVDGGTSEELLEHAGRVCYRSDKPFNVNDTRTRIATRL